MTAHTRRPVATGERLVETPIVCAFTRFHMTSPLHLPVSFREYRRVLARASSRDESGLLHADFLFSGPRTWFSFSVWRDYDAIPEFNSRTPEHAVAAGRAFARAARIDGAPQIWSTKWRLLSVTNNLEWEGFDLAGALGASGEGPL